MDKIKIFAFAGSLRKESWNKKVLEFAQTVIPEDAEVEIFDLEGIPLYNADEEGKMVQRVKDFKSHAKDADAILVASPEYNYSIPGVTKNAIDWASRPKGDNSFGGKAGAVMGASNGRIGTARAQYELRKVLSALDVRLLNFPEIIISEVQNKFDENGNLTDEVTKTKITEQMQKLVQWAKQLKK